MARAQLNLEPGNQAKKTSKPFNPSEMETGIPSLRPYNPPDLSRQCGTINSTPISTDDGLTHFSYGPEQHRDSSPLISSRLRGNFESSSAKSRLRLRDTRALALASQDSRKWVPQTASGKQRRRKGPCPLNSERNRSRSPSMSTRGTGSPAFKGNRCLSYSMRQAEGRVVGRQANPSDSLLIRTGTCLPRHSRTDLQQRGRGLPVSISTTSLLVRNEEQTRGKQDDDHADDLEGDEKNKEEAPEVISRGRSGELRQLRRGVSDSRSRRTYTEKLLAKSASARSRSRLHMAMRQVGLANAKRQAEKQVRQSTVRHFKSNSDDGGVVDEYDQNSEIKHNLSRPRKRLDSNVEQNDDSNGKMEFEEEKKSEPDGNYRNGVDSNNFQQDDFSDLDAKNNEGEDAAENALDDEKVDRVTREYRHRSGTPRGISKHGRFSPTYRSQSRGHRPSSIASGKIEHRSSILSSRSRSHSMSQSDQPEYKSDLRVEELESHHPRRVLCVSGRGAKGRRSLSSSKTSRSLGSRQYLPASSPLHRASPTRLCETGSLRRQRRSGLLDRHRPHRHAHSQGSDQSHVFLRNNGTDIIPCTESTGVVCSGTGRRGMRRHAYLTSRSDRKGDRRDEGEEGEDDAEGKGNFEARKGCGTPRLQTAGRLFVERDSRRMDVFGSSVSEDEIEGDRGGEEENMIGNEKTMQICSHPGSEAPRRFACSPGGPHRGRRRGAASSSGAQVLSNSAGGGLGARRSRSRESTPESSNSNGDSADERLYCICRKVSFGDMIACDNPRCKVEWFHFSCVDVRAQPKGKWFCPQCRGETPRVKRPDA
ncbi:unnamed protein product [Protopolystoma xenopodis]|uniref:PHD-type domain-containing protein n=1 Tax=Protopolystoma xenopodis TaxID=117903 RepID=A0A448WFL6_9PLAT|nr:unnamed protein product [Protopolystoma xenopodis]